MNEYLYISLCMDITKICLEDSSVIPVRKNNHNIYV
jgi:hypothetical protein